MRRGHSPRRIPSLSETLLWFNLHEIDLRHDHRRVVLLLVEVEAEPLADAQHGVVVGQDHSGHALDLLGARKGRRLVGVTAVLCCSAMISDAFSGGAATLRRLLRGDRQILALIEVVLIDGQAPIQSVRPSTKSIASKIKDFSVLFSPMRTT